MHGVSDLDEEAETREQASMSREGPYYRGDLAMVHHLGFGFHADGCAPGILELLGPVRERNGLVVELGCGSGLLTQYLVDAGHRVIATDASPAMLDIARTYAGDAIASASGIGSWRRRSA
jgi:2-polyprenyl-3-methyl-5-hydroxy-6-metoxy-1,4-benzoquinol methylase